MVSVDQVVQAMVAVDVDVRDDVYLDVVTTSCGLLRSCLLG